MKELKTLSKVSPSSYTGTISPGTKITFGKRHSVSISPLEYSSLLSHFCNKVVPIGASRTYPPSSFLGY